VENFRTEMSPDPLPYPGGEGNLRGMLIDVLQTLLISLALFMAINFVSARIRVESVSMRETLHPGDFVLVNRVAYNIQGFETGEIGRGDVVVFDPPFDSEEPYVKRVIGLPGEVVTIKDGKVYVGDVLVQEPYIRADFHSSGTWEVPLNEIFVMGDNRNNSSDSRSWGTVPVENIIGKALFVYWPAEQWGALTSSAAAASSP
jgi:signal peptidase I